MTTTASTLVSLLKNPKTSPNHFPHHSQSDVSKTIVSANLIMSLSCLNPFITHCLNVPPTGSTFGSLHLFPPHPSPNTTFVPNCWWFSARMILSLSLQSLPVYYSFCLECSLLPFIWFIPNYLSDFRVDVSSSRKPPLTLKPWFCALR